MLFEVDSRKSLEEIGQGLMDAAARHKFGVLTVHDLQETMRKKGVEFGRAVRIFEVCNPHQAKKVLEANPAVSTALPCRISVYETEQGMRLSTILPSEMMKMFGGGMEETAREVEEVVKAMMREAA
ncbi:MAG: DUF302 domain-containing protein [Bryobacteraceae bacterium]|nr:DUF302 domain-containing protein [Bryobacteraceae bacterium]